MDFNDTAADAAYRTQVRGWLDANAGRLPPSRTTWSARRDGRAFEGMAGEEACCRLCRHHLAEVDGRAGAEPDAPDHFQPGGEPRPCADRGCSRSDLVCACRPCSPMAAPKVVDRYVAKALVGEEVWCQLFSEPAAGSDLAGIRTKAVQAMATTGSSTGRRCGPASPTASDFGIVVCRTDPAAAQAQGADDVHRRHARGGRRGARHPADVGPAATSTRCSLPACAFNDSHRLGAVGDGWKVALTTLMHERLAVGGKPRHAPGYATLIGAGEGRRDGARAGDRADRRAGTASPRRTSPTRASS